MVTSTYGVITLVETESERIGFNNDVQNVPRPFQRPIPIPIGTDKVQ